jgi:hypothetical protein
MSISLVPQSTDVAGPTNNAALLKALKERRALQDMMAGGGRTAQSAERPPAFAPQNMGQAAFGYAGVAANALGDRMVLEREKKAQTDRLMHSVTALKQMAPEHFGNMPDTAVLGMLVADPDLPSKVAMKRYELAHRPPTVTPWTEGGGYNTTPAPMPSGLGPRPGAPAAPSGPVAGASAAAAAGTTTPMPDGSTTFRAPPKQTAGRKAQDEAFGKEMADWGPGGGYVQFQSDTQKLKELAGTLRNPKHNYSGPIIGNAPAWAGGFIPQVTEMKENVQDIVQKNLKQILGAQFTQREAEALADRAYNPRQPEELNAKRLERLQATMEKAAEAKARAMEHFERYGTLDDYKVAWKLRDASAFINDLDDLEEKKRSRPGRSDTEKPAEAPVALSGDAPAAAPSVDDLLKKYGPQ